MDCSTYSESIGRSSTARKSVVHYIQKIQYALEAVHSAALENEMSSKHTMKLWYDQTARTRSYEPGNQLLLQTSSNRSSG